MKLKEKVTEEPKNELIPPSAYIKDIKLRWNLVVKELKDFWIDVKKAFEYLKPYLIKGFDKAKELFKMIKKKIKK